MEEQHVKPPESTDAVHHAVDDELAGESMVAKPSPLNCAVGRPLAGREVDPVQEKNASAPV
jgi:hypothetical protein